MSDNPKISVVMPVWNGGKYVREAIDSILNQTFSDFEFIIIDDGSTDQTIAIIESYDDPRIRLFKREHEGIVSALNFGVEHARADWIARQDADDLSHPRRFEWQWRAVHRQNGTVLCYGNADYIDENGGRALVRESHFARTQALLRVLMLFKCPIIHTSVLFNKDAFSAAGGYLQEERHAEDYGLWGRMLADGRFAPVSKRLVRFRVHPESISNKCGTEQSSLTIKLRRQHSRLFSGLDDNAAQRMSERMQSGKFVDWVAGCFAYLRSTPYAFSVEMLGWMGSQGIRRIIK